MNGVALIPLVSAVLCVVLCCVCDQADYQKLYYLSTYFAPPFAPVDPGLPLPVPDPNATQVYPNPTFTTTSAPTNPIITYFYTSGNQIVDRSGATVQFTGVNWCRPLTLP